MLDKWKVLGHAVATQRSVDALGRRLAPGGLGGTTESVSPVVPTDKGAAVPATVPETGGATAAYVLIEDVTGASALNNNSTLVIFDSIVESVGDHGLTPHPSIPGIWTLAEGLYTVCFNVLAATNAVGVREAHLSGTVSIAALTYPPMVTVNATAGAGEVSNMSGAAIVRSAAGADSLQVFARQTSGGALVVVGRSLSVLRHP